MLRVACETQVLSSGQDQHSTVLLVTHAYAQANDPRHHVKAYKAVSYHSEPRIRFCATEVERTVDYGVIQ